jgi:hypothetical protein
LNVEPTKDGNSRTQVDIKHRLDLGCAIREPSMGDIACTKLKVQKAPGDPSLLNMRQHDNLHEFAVDIVRLLARDMRVTYT